MRTVPLKRIVGINLHSLPETTEPGFEFRYVDIGAVGRGQLISEPEETVFAAAPSRARRLVRQGDTIISTVRTYLRAVWPVRDAATDLVVSTGFAVLTPTGSIDSRYLGWLAQSDVVVEEVVARSVGVSYPAINPSDIGTLRVPLPPLAFQRAIADYLDRETARIDALIEKKQRMIELTEERSASDLEYFFGRWERVPLRRLSRRIDVGIAEASTHAYADEGVPLIRSTNIRRQGLDLSDLLYIEPWFAHRNRSKYVLAGDILTVRTGDVGVSAVVPLELDHSQCFTQLITTLDPDQHPALVCAALNSGDALRYFQEAGWGSAQANISVPLLAGAPVPKVPAAEQTSAQSEVLFKLDRAERLLTALRKQTHHLREHRHALVTSAVSGEREIPEVAA